MKKLHRKNTLNKKIFLGLIIALIILYGINIVNTNRILSPLKEKAETQKPASLSFFLIKNDCENCFDMNNYINFIKRQNVKVIQENTLESSSTEAKTLIAKHNIQSLPALIISGEVSKPDIVALWNNVGEKVNNEVVVIEGIPPYYDLENEKVVGLVEVVYLIDNSCVECYDVNVHQNILPRFGIYIDKSLTYDISSEKGKELIKKYDITNVPTILLSPEASAYSSFVQVWSQVGTQESDGWYVFRNLEIMGTYKDLKLGKIVRSGQQPTENVKAVVVEGTEFEFNPSSISVTKGEKVRITFKNVGSSVHDFYIEELGIKTNLLNPGESQTVEFIADKTGTFTFYCTVPGHKELGMEGEIKVNAT